MKVEASQSCVLHYIPDGGVLAAIGGRDSSLFLFRALGKILYCKRDSGERGREEGERESGEKMESDGADSPPCLPEHLKQHERNRLLVNPEVQCTTCTMYIHCRCKLGAPWVYMEVYIYMYKLL